MPCTVAPEGTVFGTPARLAGGRSCHLNNLPSEKSSYAGKPDHTPLREVRVGPESRSNRKIASPPRGLGVRIGESPPYRLP